MSFRSRSRTVQPAVQRRSLSGSRLPSNITSSYTSNRPMSSAYPSSTAYNSSNYISPYTSAYSTSRDSIYGSIQSPRNSYYNGSNVSTRRDSYNGSTTIYKNPYTSDRYISPYTSYDNGVTTAGLSIKSSTYGTNGYTNKSTYTPLLSNKSSSTSTSTTSSLRHASKHLSTSNTSLNSYSTPSIGTVSSGCLGRSQSFRDQTTERKSRGLRRNSSLKYERSLSVSSEKSEGYEVNNMNNTFFLFTIQLNANSFLKLNTNSMCRKAK